ncbi:MAG: MCE family protein, partial [Rhodospirillales bacterium]|nr:MCE family protein [Rhodospirillales bacterium]
MRSSKINYLLVGVFVIGMVVALVVSVALLTGRTGATDLYYSYYENVTGVKFGTQVVYEGYPIGQVEQV